MHIAESEKIKKTFAFNVDIFKTAPKIEKWFTNRPACGRISKYEFGPYPVVGHSDLLLSIIQKAGD